MDFPITVIKIVCSKFFSNLEIKPKPKDSLSPQRSQKITRFYGGKINTLLQDL